MKKSLNVFFVSNSTCYYFTDELMGLLDAAGYENVTLALVYASGCSIEKHHRWLQTGYPGYQFRVLTPGGLEIIEECTLEKALGHANWDVISFDNNARSFASGDARTALSLTEPYFGELYNHIRQKFPNAKYYWHQVWANEIGYQLAFKMETIEQRTCVYRAKRAVMEHMVKTYDIGGIPTGDAWEMVRDMELFTRPVAPFLDAERFSLCSRIVKEVFRDDYTHDGDIGGGQYLNACVWFEMLTGESCLENSFRPVYKLGDTDCSLTEEKITVLQNAAHRAVKAWLKT